MKIIYEVCVWSAPSRSGGEEPDFRLDFKPTYEDILKASNKRWFLDYVKQCNPKPIENSRDEGHFSFLSDDKYGPSIGVYLVNVLTKEDLDK